MKERILLTALRLFAAGGYEAVSVSDIAGALGVTKGALYRHYRSKREIFEQILRRMERRDAEQAAAHDLPGDGPAEGGALAMADVIAFSKSMFRYWTQEDFASQFRRMLTLEQFRSAEMAGLYQQYLASGPLDYVADLFSAMGLPEPRRAAAEFYGPMFLLYSVYDGAENKKEILSSLDETLERIGARLEGQTRSYCPSPES